MLNVNPAPTGALAGALLGALYLGTRRRSRPLIPDLLLGAFAGAVTGCTLDDIDPLVAAKRGWVRAGLKPIKGCLDLVRISQVESPTYFQTLCAGGENGACLVRPLDADPNAITIVLGPEATIDQVIHEAMHALVRCTFSFNFPDAYDDAHKLQNVWAQYGEHTAEARARRLLG